MQQWKTEIETKSDADLKVCIHHGAGKKTARELRRYDIVLTSYNTAAAEWVDPKPPRKKAGAGKKGQTDGDSDDAPSKGAASKEKGPLFGVDRWYRSEFGLLGRKRNDELTLARSQSFSTRPTRSRVALPRRTRRAATSLGITAGASRELREYLIRARCRQG